MTSEAPLNLMRRAIKAAQEGRREEALELADRYSAAAASAISLSAGRSGDPEISFLGPAALVDATGPGSGLLVLIAPNQNLYMMLKEWELAALKGADVCALAEVLAPETTATSGDYATLADALERLGRYDEALRATTAAIHHLKKTGDWEKYRHGYDARKERLQQAMASRDSTEQSTGEDYWDDLRSVCVGHVRKMIRYFDAHGATHMDFARPRFELLVSDKVLDAVISVARRHLREHPEGAILPIPATVAGNWFIVVSVYPSAKDRDFLEKCPGKSFPDLARAARQMFRMVDVWSRLDVAHWILLVESRKGSVHLHTHWSLDNYLKWLKEAGETRPVPAPPTIVPESLLTDKERSLPMDLLMEDAQAFQGPASGAK